MRNLLPGSAKLIAYGAMIGSLFLTPTKAMELPDDMVRGVCRQLPPRELAIVSFVSKQWKRVAEGDELWQRHGVTSKKVWLFNETAFPFPMLEQAHVAVLFKHGYLSSNALYFWNLDYKCDRQDDLMNIFSKSDVNFHSQWELCDVTRSEEKSNSVQYTMKIKFVTRSMKSSLTHTIPCILNLKGSWWKATRSENENEMPLFSKPTFEEVMQIIATKQHKDLLGYLWEVKENDHFKTIYEYHEKYGTDNLVYLVDAFTKKNLEGLTHCSVKFLPPDDPDRWYEFWPIYELSLKRK